VAVKPLGRRRQLIEHRADSTGGTWHSAWPGKSRGNQGPFLNASQGGIIQREEILKTPSTTLQQSPMRMLLQLCAVEKKENSIDGIRAEEGCSRSHSRHSRPVGLCYCRNQSEHRVALGRETFTPSILQVRAFKGGRATQVETEVPAVRDGSSYIGGGRLTKGTASTAHSRYEGEGELFRKTCSWANHHRSRAIKW